MDHEENTFEVPTPDRIRGVIDGLVREAEETYFNNNHPALLKVGRYGILLTMAAASDGARCAISLIDTKMENWGAAEIQEEEDWQTT